MNSFSFSPYCSWACAGLTLALLVTSAKAQEAKVQNATSPVATSAATPVARPVSTPTYKEWIRKYKEPLRSADNTKVVFTVIEKEDDGSSAMRGLEDRFAMRNVQRTGERRLDYQYGIRGNAQLLKPLSLVEMAHLDQLLATLPDDRRRLPPAGRRLVVQVPQRDDTLVRVYDRAQLPEVVQQIAVLTGGRLPSVVCPIASAAQWTVNTNHDTGTIAASGDGKSILSLWVNDKLKFWNVSTRTFVREENNLFPPFTERLTVSPDGTLAASEGWLQITVADARTGQPVHNFNEPQIGQTKNRIDSPQFTPDGRYFLLEKHRPDPQTYARTYLSFPPTLEIYDTKTWQRVPKLPGMPDAAATYAPSPKGSRAVYLSAAGVLKMWDTRRERDLATLASDVRVGRIAYSPDNSLVAVNTIEKDHTFFNSWRVNKIRIWKTRDGKLLHELSPLEMGQCHGVAEMLWTPDGRYLIGGVFPNDSYSSWTVAVWNARDGRQRGELYGTGQTINGMALLPDGQLFVGSNDGIIRVWNTPQVFTQIAAFEKSLPKT
ncbi:hypothetical protein IAD21_03274 [Abditibacteriota bacterium]|nr:hypothetical protein IAD21_03274 [Abditibacteriota bacterium]